MKATPNSGAMRFAARGHHRLAYEVVGPEAASGGSAVVLLHSLLGARGDFQPVREALLAGGQARLLLPDARGHGASAALTNLVYSLDDMVAELAAILDAESVDEVHLVGHELGGVAAFAFAGTYPGRVRSLTMIEPALDLLLDDAVDPAVRAERAEARRSDRAAADAAYKGLTDQALDRYLDPRWGAGWRERLTKPRLAALRRNAGALGGTLVALDEASLSTSILASIEAPIHIVQRENAPLLTAQIAQHVANEAPTTQLVIVANADSPLGGEAGAVVGALIRDVVLEN